MRHKGLTWLLWIVTVFACLGVLTLTVGKYLFVRYLLRSFGFSVENASSIGIIGGADGPTAIFLSSSNTTPWLLPSLVVTAVAGVVALFMLYKTKRR